MVSCKLNFNTFENCITHNNPFFLYPDLPMKRNGSIFTLLLFFSFTFSNIHGQTTDAKQIAKLSPGLVARIKSDQLEGLSVFTIAVNNPEKFLQWINSRAGSVNLIYEYKPANTFVVKAGWKSILDTLLTAPYILFIDERRIPKEELQVSTLDLSVNKINIVHSKHPQWNGNAVALSVKENKMDTTDIDFKDFFLLIFHHLLSVIMPPS